LPNNELARKVQVACDFYQTEDQRPHLIWYYDALMSQLTISDLTTEELAALVAVLTASNARKLAPADGPETPGGIFVEVVGSTPLERRLRAVS
jgi:hypothetical protein